MSSTPAQRFVCPRCRRSFEEPTHFCRECGADMTRASALEAAGRGAPVPVRSGDAGPVDAPESGPIADRRLSDSNRAWLGKIVDGRYRVLEVIGRGGMGVVYRVEHLRMGKLAAMKVLHHDLAQDLDVVARFEREAAAVSQLHHPHTVQVFDFGTAQGALYLIMELVRGLDMARVIDRDGPMPWARAAPLLAQVCGALHEAHELGIVHRDLKPENVLITRTTDGHDYAKVLDFGLAKLDPAHAASPKRETERQAIVGTPYFMAPEQIRGDKVDGRTDIYSLGALMFELLTGQHLYSGATAVGVLTKHLTAEPDAPSMRAPAMGIPPAVDQLCRKALARRMEDRWQSAAELGEAIEEIYRETVAESTGPGQARAARAARRGGTLVFDDDTPFRESDGRLRRSDIDAYEESLRRRRWLVGAVTALIAVGAVGGIAWLLTRSPALVTEEREPNDDAASANRIGIGRPVSGLLGKRLSTSEGDRDVYRLDFPAGSARVVTVSVTKLPNIDLVVTVADRQGLHEVKLDDGAIDEDEVLHRRAIDGAVTVTVGQVLAKGQFMPVENVSDPYVLTVVEEPAAGGEVEPNGNAADANAIGVGEQLRGWLDTRDDVDLLRWTGGAGAHDVVVEADGVPVAWQVNDGATRTPGMVRLELRQGDLFRIRRGAGDAAKRHGTWGLVVTAATR
jgi:eukaryotic-like serine/threonine-protein kinase